jgi:TolB protein
MPFVSNQTACMKPYAILLAVMIAGCGKDHNGPRSSGNNKEEIVFISRRIDNSADWKLYIMDANGKNQRALTDRLVECAPPVLSNDGSRIAFMTYENNERHIYVIDKTGQNQVHLASGKQYCGSIAWSPDDARILFIKSDNMFGGHYDIYSIASQGGVAKRLTDNGTNYAVSWYPDGKNILHTAAVGDKLGVYKMKDDGSNRQLITPATQSFSYGRLSPDTRTIALVSANREGSQIFTMQADGTGLRQLTTTVSPFWDAGFSRDANSSPVWSPDGRQIAYISYIESTPDILVMNADGTNKKRLTVNSLRDESPSWTKDGRHIIFSSNRDMNFSSEVYIMNANGSQQKPLTNYKGDDIYPSMIE